MSFYQAYKALVEPILGRTLTSADGCAVRPALRIPSALADYYVAVGAIHMINRRHDRLLDPSALQVEDGMVIFYEENQGVAYWAIREVDLHLPDPTVYLAQDTTAGLEWSSENMTVSSWFPFMIHWQIVNGGFQFGAGQQALGMPNAPCRRITRSCLPALTARRASTVWIPRSFASLPAGRWRKSGRPDAQRRTFVTSILFSLSNGITPSFRNSDMTASRAPRHADGPERRPAQSVGNRARVQDEPRIWAPRRVLCLQA